MTYNDNLEKENNLNGVYLKIDISDIDKLTERYVGFVADNIPQDKQDYYTNMLYNTINNMYKLLINSASNNNLEQENTKLKKKLKSIKKEIKQGVSNAWDGINDIENITCSID